MSDTVMIIEPGPMPKILGRGRPKGAGKNIKLLRRLKVNGDPLFGVPPKKVRSLRQTGSDIGIKFRARQIPDADGKPSGLYAIQRTA